MSVSGLSAFVLLHPLVKWKTSTCVAIFAVCFVFTALVYANLSTPVSSHSLSKFEEIDASRIWIASMSLAADPVRSFPALCESKLTSSQKQEI